MGPWLAPLAALRAPLGLRMGSSRLLRVAPHAAACTPLWDARVADVPLHGVRPKRHCPALRSSPQPTGPWRPDCPGWCREGRSRPMTVQRYWLELVADGLVHNGAVLESADVCLKAMNVCPRRAANLVTGHRPLREAFELLHTIQSLRGGRHIDEHVTEVPPRSEVARHVHEIELTCKSVYL